ncbi:heavy metal translocating P-type ATPase [Marinilactibacillus piezotolerans]|uniref:heavy metal translocating P-type ATPase n=1 Tax=Marinilactibacillus piezotolerans TaxID=258723 RepID=UPI0009B17671|nr:cation-translocating P-type ATPase [Marinilactibacillus piezotolerans]
MVAYIHQHKNELTALSGILIVSGFVFGGLGNESLQDIALVTATVIASIPIFVKAILALRMKAFSIDLLVSIAVIGALSIGEYTESSIVTFLFLFGDYLELRTLEKTRSSLKSLIDMAPKEAVILQENGVTKKISVEDLQEGDCLIIHSGGKIAVDGTVAAGSASINESAITGESVPTSKSIGDQVFSGTILDSGYVEVIAEKVGEDTTFAKIIELVEEAQDSKTKTEKFLDRFAGIYTPAIVMLSILVYGVTLDLHLAITFLVIACPGALVIGAPVSSVAGIGNGAKNGVLIKGGESMDKLAKIDTLVFDKTGTLTQGKPSVTDVHTFKNTDQSNLLQLAARAEMISEHHLGQTIVAFARSQKMDFTSLKQSEGEVIKGKGIKTVTDHHQLVIGNRNLMKIEQISISAIIEDYAISREKKGNTAIFVAVDGDVSGVISIADQIRKDAKQALEQMRKDGIKKIVMLTGDNQYTAEAVANELQLDEFYAELLPENKVEYIKRLKASGHKVAMAGDGINDAPAIATADIGLAMGEGGTDISMETADVVLMADQLLQFSHAYALSKATVNNIKQNIMIAVGTVAVLLSGVLIGNIHLASGMFIHEASVLAVILNAMRLIRFKSNGRYLSKKVEISAIKA